MSFEKKVKKNAELRARYESDPPEFMASEADLDAEIKSWSLLSEHPELYEEFAEGESVRLLVGLLAHENTDIAIGVIEIISELVDEDVEAEQEQWDVLVRIAMTETFLLDVIECGPNAHAVLSATYIPEFKTVANRSTRDF